MSNVLIYPKLYFGPMSKNIVDAVISVATETHNPYGLIASRRQVDKNGGYVEDWTTSSLCHYIHARTDYVFFCRDHGGPGQGAGDSITNSSGMSMKTSNTSFKNDMSYMDIVHIDPWKIINQNSFKDGIDITIELLKYCYKISPNVQFEIGTEEAIYKYDPGQLDDLLNAVKSKCNVDLYRNIKYACIQSGVGLDLIRRKNIGKFDNKRFSDFINICIRHNMLSKEHNGDFLNYDDVEDRFDNGLDGLNIAPELATVESAAIWNEFLLSSNYEAMQKTWELCRDYAPWQKWVGIEFNPEKEDKVDFVVAFCHYIYNHPEFKKIIKRSNLDNDRIFNILKEHIYKLDNIAYGKNNIIRS